MAPLAQCSTPCPAHAVDPSHSTPFYAPSTLSCDEAWGSSASDERRVSREELAVAKTTGVKAGVRIDLPSNVGGGLADG